MSALKSMASLPALADSSNTKRRRIEQWIDGVKQLDSATTATTTPASLPNTTHLQQPSQSPPRANSPAFSLSGSTLASCPATPSPPNHQPSSRYYPTTQAHLSPPTSHPMPENSGAPTSTTTITHSSIHGFPFFEEFPSKGAATTDDIYSTADPNEDQAELIERCMRDLYMPRRLSGTIAGGSRRATLYIPLDVPMGPFRRKGSVGSASCGAEAMLRRIARRVKGGYLRM